MNTVLLKDKIEKSGLKTSYIIEKLGYSRTAYYFKLKGERPFRACDIYVLSDLLKLTKEEVTEIFLS